MQRYQLKGIIAGVLMTSCQTPTEQERFAHLKYEVYDHVEHLARLPGFYNRNTRRATTDLHMQVVAAAEHSRWARLEESGVRHERLVDWMTAATMQYGLRSADTQFIALAFGPRFWTDVVQSLKEKEQ